MEDFIYHVNVLADHCACGQLQDEMVRDRIVVGIRDAKLSQKLQMDAELTQEKATQLIRKSEAVKLQQTVIRSDDATEVAAVNRRFSWCHAQKSKQLLKPQQTPHTQPSATCIRCGQAPHGKMQCPAGDQICHKCKKKGHFQKLCRSKTVPRKIQMMTSWEQCMWTLQTLKP